MKSGIIKKSRIFSALMLIFVLFYSIPALSQQPAANGTADLARETDQQPSDIGGWRVEDFRPYIKSLSDLRKLSDEYSNNLLNMAIDEYATGIDILEDMQVEIKKLQNVFAKRNNLNERWYWQEIDRKNQEKRQIAMIKVEAKVKSVTYFTRAINHLDEIQSAQVTKDPKYINAQIALFQVYVSTQYDVGNLMPCIPILERYVRINEKTKNDPWAYEYLASCYGFMESQTAKSKIVGEQERIKWKQNKNRSLLTAAELKYGIESPQYKHLKEIVELDEKKSITINEFK